MKVIKEGDFLVTQEGKMFEITYVDGEAFLCDNPIYEDYFTILGGTNA